VRAAASIAAAALASAACSERMTSTERFTLGPPAPGAAVAPGQPEAVARAEPLFAAPLAEGTWPVFAPDGSRCAIEARSDATWATRVGDPLPPEGLAARIEAHDCDPRRAGRLTTVLEGPWVLGRSATAEGFLVERPRADGGRDVGIAAWDGGVRMVAEDGATNAFATARPDGSLAWCRRAPEGGDWHLVVARPDGSRRVTAPAPGSSMLMPVFSGDGAGLFALRLDGRALSACWIALGADGLPAPDAASRPGASVPISMRSNLSLAVECARAAPGAAASPAGRDDVLLWLHEARTVGRWAPGGEVERLPPGTRSAVLIDDDNALATRSGGVHRQRMPGTAPPGPALLAEPWVLVPVGGDQPSFVGARAPGVGQVEVARISLEARQAPETGSR
jgi:hypothetical protein